MMKLVLVVVALIATQCNAGGRGLLDLSANLPVVGSILGGGQGVSQGHNKQKEFESNLNYDEALNYDKKDKRFANEYYARQGGYPQVQYPIHNHYPQRPCNHYIPLPRPRPCQRPQPYPLPRPYPVYQPPQVQYGSNQGRETDERLNYRKNVDAGQKGRDYESSYYNGPGY